MGVVYGITMTGRKGIMVGNVCVTAMWKKDGDGKQGGNRHWEVHTNYTSFRLTSMNQKPS